VFPTQPVSELEGFPQTEGGISAGKGEWPGGIFGIFLLFLLVLGVVLLSGLWTCGVLF
jgi:hypothetical protein